MYLIGLGPLSSSYPSSSLITKAVKMRREWESRRKKPYMKSRDPFYREHAIGLGRKGAKLYFLVAYEETQGNRS